MAPQVHWNLKIGAKKTKQWWIRLQKDVMNPPASRTIKSTDGSDHFFSCGLRLNATLRNTVQDFSYIGSSQQEARRSFRVEFACSACVCMANSIPSLTATSCISSFFFFFPLMSHFLILALLYLPVAFISIVEFDRLQKSMRNTNGWGFKVLVSVFLSVLWNNNTGN